MCLGVWHTLSQTGLGADGNRDASEILPVNERSRRSRGETLRQSRASGPRLVLTLVIGISQVLLGCFAKAVRREKYTRPMAAVAIRIPFHVLTAFCAQRI